MLICAISDPTGTSPALAKVLGVSLPTVKKMWLSIYERVSEIAPELIAGNAKIGADNRRGKEKRRHLLAYLQDHPEELRPVLRRSTGQSAATP
jgi:hypothetical protein